MQYATTTVLQGLVVRLNAGDQEVRSELIGRACERLRRLARKMLKSFGGVQRYEEADDVLQNAVVRLLQALKSTTPSSAAEFFGLATRQMRWELLALAQRHGKRQELRVADLPQHDGGSLAHTPSCGPADCCQSTLDPVRLQLWSDFHARVQSLPEEERQVFDLLWFQDLTQEEAASVLTISLATLKRRWASARLQLGRDVPVEV
jgi:RNA polymerase sigma-70 factor (ECF subfamily)